MNYVVDTNIINWLVDGKITTEDLPNNGKFLVTHIQVDELNKTKDEERRAQLFLKFATAVDDIIPTETMVVGVSRIGMSKIGDGVTYGEILTELNNLNNSKKNNSLDALIAEVAIINQYTLITADSALNQAVINRGGSVIYFQT